MERKAGLAKLDHSQRMERVEVPPASGGLQRNTVASARTDWSAGSTSSGRAGMSNTTPLEGTATRRLCQVPSTCTGKTPIQASAPATDGTTVATLPGAATPGR